MSGAHGMVGRVKELKSLHAQVHSALNGGGALTLIEGEAGIGKTTLVQAAQSYASDKGFTLLTGAGDELFPDRPFGPVFDAVRREAASQGVDLQGWLAGHWEKHSEPDDIPAETRSMILEGVVSLLEKAALKGPVLLTLEDLHWADSSSFLAVRSIAKRLLHLPVAVFLTFRSSSSASPVPRLLKDLPPDAYLRITLEPLSDDAVLTLAESLLAGPPGPTLHAFLTHAGGNPFFVVELIRSLQDRGELIRSAGSVEIENPLVPGSLGTTILARLSFLSPRATELLKVASVLGRSFDPAHLSAVVGEEAVQVLSPLEEARGAGVLIESEKELVFRHQLTRDAIYSDLPASLRTALHRQAARALAEIGASPHLVASHFTQAAKPGDTEAMHWLRSAAMNAAPAAPGVAEDLLRRALSLEPDPQYREVLEEDLVSVLDRVGRLDEAQVLARKLISTAPSPEVEARRRLNLTLNLLRAGKFIEAHLEAQTAIAAGREGVPDTIWARTNAEAGWGYMATGDIAGARAQAENSLEMARKCADPQAAMTALNVLAFAQMWTGDIEAALQQSLEGLSAAEKLTTRQGAVWAEEKRLPLGLALMEADRFDEARVEFHRALESGILAPWAVMRFQAALGVLEFLAGRWADARVEMQTTIQTAEEAETPTSLFTPYTILALISLFENKIPEGETALCKAEEQAARWGLGIRGEWLLWARSLMEESRHNDRQALDALENAWSMLTMGGPSVGCVVLGPEVIRRFVATDPDFCRLIAEQVGHLAGKMKTPSARGSWLACRGLMQGDPALLKEAARVLEAKSGSLERACTLEDAGRLLLETDRAEAVRLFEQALSLYDALGAGYFRRRLEAVLRGAGVRPGRRGRRTSVSTGWEALTATEKEVARLAQEGLPRAEIGSRLFISPRTVETHLSQIFRKLGVTTRIELLAKLASEDLSGPTA